MATWQKRGKSYLIRVSNGMDEHGNRSRKSMTWTPPPGMSAREIKKELNRQIVKFEEAVDMGEVGNLTITLDEFAEIWLRDYAKTQLKATTRQNYTRMLNDRILPALGPMRLCKIRPQHLITFYRLLQEPGNKNKSYYQADPSLKQYLKSHKITHESVAEASGLSCTTVRNALRGKHVYGATMEAIMKALELPADKYFRQIGAPTTISGSTALYYHHILSSIFTAAVQWQFIPSNPCARVKPPRRHKAEAIYLEEEDIFRLLKCLDSVEFMYKVLINLYIFTGMRRGEALGLTWQDIRFDKNLIDINKELVYVHESGVQVDSPKNEYSKRVIKVPPSLMELLKKLQKEQEANRKLYGDKYEPSGFVFTNKLGQRLHPDTVSAWFGRFIKKNELPPIHLHSLRHTNASLLIAHGTDVKTVSKRLGHSNTQTTTIIYAHQIRTADEAAAEMLDLLINRRDEADESSE